KVVGAKAHVAVHVADVLSAAVLKPELRARAAGSFFDAVQTNNLDRVIEADRDGPVGRSAVCQDHFPRHPVECSERTLDAGCNMPFFIERLDDDAHSWPRL